jgi:hypothetical protein
VAKKGERFEMPPPPQPPSAQAAVPSNLEPDEGLRLMKAFAKIRRRGHREILISLAVALADIGDEN